MSHDTGPRASAPNSSASINLDQTTPKTDQTPHQQIQYRFINAGDIAKPENKALMDEYFWYRNHTYEKTSGINAEMIAESNRPLDLNPQTCFVIAIDKEGQFLGGIRLLKSSEGEEYFHKCGSHRAPYSGLFCFPEGKSSKDYSFAQIGGLAVDHNKRKNRMGDALGQKLQNKCLEYCLGKDEHGKHRVDFSIATVRKANINAVGAVLHGSGLEHFILNTNTETYGTDSIYWVTATAQDNERGKEVLRMSKNTIAGAQEFKEFRKEYKRLKLKEKENK